MTGEDEKFLNAGLRNYPAAIRAVQEFSARIQKRLDDRLQRHWPIGSKYGGSSGRGDLYIEAYRSVTLRDGSQAAVSAGIAWQGDAPYIFVCCFEGPEWAMRPAADHFEREGQYKVLSKDFDLTDPDIDRDIDVAIDNWENALNPPKATAQLTLTKKKLSTRVHG